MLNMKNKKNNPAITIVYAATVLFKEIKTLSNKAKIPKITTNIR